MGGRGRRVRMALRGGDGVSYIDLTGQRFGRLTVVESAGSSKGKRYWVCLCDCGTVRKVKTEHLRSGHTKSCGCLSRDKASERSLIDLTGHRFGRLTVVKRVGTKKSFAVWLCQCDCGKTATLPSAYLRTGQTRSCGCLAHDVLVARNTSHGGSYSRLYRIWHGMRQRCTDPNSSNYENYGGRGITVCDEWMHDFAAFQKWALANGYHEDLTIDRINNDSGYRPDNCRWATRHEQRLNQRPRRKRVMPCNSSPIRTSRQE